MHAVDTSALTLTTTDQHRREHSGQHRAGRRRPAVAGALYIFDGIRRMTLPMKDSPAARAIGIKP